MSGDVLQDRCPNQLVPLHRVEIKGGGEPQGDPEGFSGAFKANGDDNNGGMDPPFSFRWGLPRSSLATLTLSLLILASEALKDTDLVRVNTIYWPWPLTYEGAFGFGAAGLIAGLLGLAGCIGFVGARWMVLLSNLSAFILGVLYCKRWSVRSDTAMLNLMIRMRDGPDRNSVIERSLEGWPRDGAENKLRYPNWPYLTLSLLRDGSAVPLVILLGCSTISALMCLVKFRPGKPAVEGAPAGSQPDPDTGKDKSLVPSAVILVVCGLFTNYSRVLLTNLSESPCLVDTFLSTCYTIDFLMSAAPLIVAGAIVSFGCGKPPSTAAARRPCSAVLARLLILGLSLMTLVVALFSMSSMFMLYRKRFQYFQINLPKDGSEPANPVCFYKCGGDIVGRLIFGNYCQKTCMDRAKMCDGLVDVGGDPREMSLIYSTDVISRVPALWEGSNRHPMADEAFCQPTSSLWIGLVITKVVVGSLCIRSSVVVLIAMASALKRAIQMMKEKYADPVVKEALDV